MQLFPGLYLVGLYLEGLYSPGVIATPQGAVV